MEAHRASPAEQWRYGVEWRRTGSRWYTQKPAPHYPAPEGYKGLAPVYAALRGTKTRELGTPTAMGLVGDGRHANQCTDPNKIADARYRDWLEQRNNDDRVQQPAHGGRHRRLAHRPHPHDRDVQD